MIIYMKALSERKDLINLLKHLEILNKDLKVIIKTKQRIMYYVAWFLLLLFINFRLFYMKLTLFIIKIIDKI